MLIAHLKLKYCKKKPHSNTDKIFTIKVHKRLNHYDLLTVSIICYALVRWRQ